MGASSNFGNMFSVLGASVFLPFLPMTPIQILTNNLLYDFSQTAIPTDNVDEEFLEATAQLGHRQFAKFMLFVGPVSSIFDYATFMSDASRLRRLGQACALPDGLVRRIAPHADAHHPHHPHRAIPFIQSRASGALLTTTLIVCLIGAALPYSPLARRLRLHAAACPYWPALSAFPGRYAGAGAFAEDLFRATLGNVRMIASRMDGRL